MIEKFHFFTKSQTSIGENAEDEIDKVAYVVRVFAFLMRHLTRVDR